MGKRKIAILNIDSILNKFFFEPGAKVLDVQKFKMSLYVEFG
jgi:hypothetical protein